MRSCREVADPAPLPHEALVEVKAISLNRGECRRLATMDRGSVTGWDLAGEVVQAAADGSGPAVGARVVGLKNPGAWVQRAAVDTEFLAELPDGITLEQAAIAAGRGADRAAVAGDRRLRARPSGCSSPAPAAGSAGSRSSWRSSAART